MTYTAVRLVVQQQLANDLGITMVGGRITGPIEDRDIGCAWTSTISPQDDVIAQAVDLRIRVFKQWKQTAAPVDLEAHMADLERLALDLQVSLNAIRSSAALRAAGAWFLQDMPQIEVDPDTNGVEASVIVALANAFFA